MKYKQWRVASFPPEYRQALEQAGYPGILCAVLAARGISTPEQAQALLRGTGETLLSPFDLPDMDKAAARVLLALERGELIAVYGDYDVDGITSTCLLTDLLRRMGGRVISYIPDRMGEGYGLNAEAVTALHEQGVSLIVTVDCGITAVEEVELARALGIDVVITDHHECKEILPKAVAVVDPHRPDGSYPFKGLAGVGVALKLAMAISKTPEVVLEEYSDLAAVGTVADVMPMTGENRLIVRRGLSALIHPKRLGLAMLIREAGLSDKPISTVSVGYTLAPRINASGRMGQTALALELLLTHDPARAELLARQLCELNRERQAIEGHIFQQCVEQLSRAPQSGAVLLADPGWHQGVVGIVASRLTERYNCPAFMVCLSEDGMGKGSCRSWGNINLFQLLSGCSDLLDGFGGHALAAGFTVRAEHIPALSQRLKHAAEQQRAQSDEPVSVLEADAVVQPQELTLEAIESLELLEPCGAGNPRPVLVLTGAVVHSLSHVGRGRHLKMRLDVRGTSLDAIFFSTDAAEQGIAPGSRVDVAFYPQINEFRGFRSVQLQVIDLRPAVTRAQAERAVYEKYRRGTLLSTDEARTLLPSREEFIALWRYLQRQCAPLGEMTDTPARIARGAARAAGQKETLPHTLLCLDVFAERGLIYLSRRADCLRIILRPVEQKVDLEASAIMRRLRELAGDDPVS